MSVVVRPRGSSTIAVNQGAQSSAAVIVKRADNLNIDNLQDVVTTDLQDGYTLVYNVTTDKWVSQPVSNVTLSAVDGGTY